MIENQGDTEFCWLYSVANAIVSSLWVRLRKFYHHVLKFYVFKGHVTDAGLKKAATDFLNRKDLRQKVRRELLFGLFPKTLNGKCSKVELFFSLCFSWSRTTPLCSQCVEYSRQWRLFTRSTRSSESWSCSKVLSDNQRTDEKSNNGEERLELILSTWKVQTRLSSGYHLGLWGLADQWWILPRS